MINMFRRSISKYLDGLRKIKFIKSHKNCLQITSFRDCDFFTHESNKIESVLLKGNGGYDSHNFTAVSKFVKPDAICFDIGANIGVYSVVMANIVGRHGAVHSFEPVSHIRRKLQLNMKLNNQKYIHLNDFALGAEEDEMEMLQVKKDQYRGGTSTFVHNENVSAMGVDKFEKVLVKISTLDGYVEKNNIEDMSFIKMDVEGFEWNVLDGGRESIRKFSPIILMEYDSARHEADTIKFRDFFEQEDYSVFEFSAFDEELVLVPFEFEGCPMGRNIICIKK